MNHYKDSNDIEQFKGEYQVAEEEDLFMWLWDTYNPVFEALDGVSHVLGTDHPLSRLMAGAVKSLDPEELAVAEAAYEALPEYIKHRVDYPWIGSPPPPGTREKLRQTEAPKLDSEVMGREMVGCYLQIDAGRGYRDSAHRPADKDGHAIDPALVYNLRMHEGWPVRVQIVEGSDKELALDLLKKVIDRLEEDWDRLINPDLYLRMPEDPSDWE